MESQIESQSTETIVNDTTTFVDQVAPITETPQPAVTDRSLDIDFTESLTHDAKAILGRPTFIGTAGFSNVTTSANYNTDQNYTKLGEFPADIFKNNQELANRLSGFLFFKATMVFTFQVVSTKFHAGLIWFWWDYFRNNVLDGAHPWRALSVGHVPAVTTQKGVLIDVNDTKTAILRVPYFGPTAAWNLVTGAKDCGSLFVTELLRTASPNVGNVTVSIWAHFEDIELSVPTNAPIHSSYKPVVPVSSRAALLAALAELDAEDPPRQQIGNEPQFASDSRLSTLVATAAGAIGMMGGIPVIGTVCRIASWVGAGVAVTLRGLGWSRPVDLTRDTKVNNRIKITSHYTDQPMEVDMFAPTLDAAVNFDNRCFPTTLDEMSYAYLFSLDSVYNQFRWNAGTNAGTQLASYVLSPADWEIVVGSGKNFWTPSTYLVKQHKYWRGDLVYTFRVAKTALHAGIVRISVVYGGVASGNWNNSINYIWNLESSSEFTVKIPYKAATRYLASNQALGTMYVRVESPLIAPDVVSPFINFIASTHVENGSVAVPEFAYTAWSGAYPKSHARMATVPDAVELLPRSELAQEEDEVAVPHIESGSPNSAVEGSSDVANLEADVIGYSLTNLRPLTRLPVCSYKRNATANSTVGFSVRWLGDSPGNTCLGRVPFYHEFSSLYRYARGGTRLVIDNKGAALHEAWALHVPSLGAPAPPRSNPNLTLSCPGLHEHARAMGPNHRRWNLEFPHCSVNKFRIIGLDDNKVNDLVYQMPSASIDYGYCAADDHTFAGFQGIPAQYLKFYEGPVASTLVAPAASAPSRVKRSGDGGVRFTPASV